MSFSKPTYSQFNFKDCPLQLNVIPSIYKVNQFKTFEKVDARLIDSFLKSGKAAIYSELNQFKDTTFTYKCEQTHMEAYLRLMGENTDFFYTKHFAREFGRSHASKSLSLSVFRRSTRHRLCDGVYVDYDLRNCHYRIALAYCKYHNFTCDAIQRYCDDEKHLRGALMEMHFPLTPDNENNAEFLWDRKEAAKKLPISLMNGGSYDGWKKLNKFDDAFEHPEIVLIEKEIQQLTEAIWANNPDLIDYCRKTNEGKKKKPRYSIPMQKRSVTALWFHTMERMVMEHAIVWLATNIKFKGTIESFVPCQDGFMILLEHQYNGLLDELTQATNSYFPFNQEWVQKPFDEPGDFGND